MNRRYILAVVTWSLLSPSAWAHHSFAQFDETKVVSLTGIVKDWQWANPHTWLDLMVQGADGELQLWGIEGQSPAVLRHVVNAQDAPGPGEHGIQRDTLKPGDRITITMHPRRDGTRGGSFLSVTLVDGRTLSLSPERPRGPGPR
ncbi:MAG: DUF6152 family protein [Terriglobia bacterium]